MRNDYKNIKHFLVDLKREGNALLMRGTSREGVLNWAQHQRMTITIAGRAYFYEHQR